MSNPKIVRVVTIPHAYVHIKNQLSEFSKQGKDITLISGPGDYQKVLQDEVRLPIETIDIPREINLKKDFLALISLTKFLRKVRPTIVHSTTPKAGLITSIASYLARVPIRLHTFTGQRWVTLNNPMRFILRSCDKLICTLNTWVYTDSPSQTDFLIKENIVKKNKISCLHKGCLGGIDFNRFNIELYKNQKVELEDKIGLTPKSVRLIFVGRVTKDKGIEELVTAFELAHKEVSNIELIIVGPYEKELDPISKDIESTIKNHPAIFNVGYSSTPESFLAGSDIFCIPSYREGFGTVVLEAAAMKLPSIGTNIPGLRDSIDDNKTGLLVKLKDTQDLKNAIIKLSKNKELRENLGRNALNRARLDFDDQIIAAKQWNEYEKWIRSI